MDSQRLVRVFTRIFSGFSNFNLVEFDLVDPFTAQVFIADATAAQVALGQAPQAMGLVDFQHIALEHGVVDIALHFNTVVGKHMPVVFDVLAELASGGVFKPWLETGQNLVSQQLHWRVRVVMRERNVGGLARSNAEADADNLGAHFIQRGGLCVHRHQLGGKEPGQPFIKSFPRKNGVIDDRAGGLVRWRICGFIKQARLRCFDFTLGHRHNQGHRALQ